MHKRATFSMQGPIQRNCQCQGGQKLTVKSLGGGGGGILFPHLTQVPRRGGGGGGGGGGASFWQRGF